MPIYHRGNLLANQGRIDEAIEDYTTVVSLRYQTCLCLSIIVETRHDASGETLKAIEDFTRALMLMPELTNALNNRGIAYGKLGEYDRAVQDFSAVVEIEPEHVLAYNNRGEVFFQSGSYDNALADFKHANNLQPGHLMLIAGQAVSHHALNDEESAVRLWKLLVGQDDRYLDADWVREQLNWAEPLVDEASSLIDKF